MAVFNIWWHSEETFLTRLQKLQNSKNNNRFGFRYSGRTFNKTTRMENSQRIDTQRYSSYDVQIYEQRGPYISQ